MPTVTFIILIVFHSWTPICPPLTRWCRIAVNTLEAGHIFIFIRPRAIVIVVLHSLHLDLISVPVRLVVAIRILFIGRAGDGLEVGHGVSILLLVVVGS
jgi:hypothetical protein